MSLDGDVDVTVDVTVEGRGKMRGSRGSKDSGSSYMTEVKDWSEAGIRWVVFMRVLNREDGTDLGWHSFDWKSPLKGM